MNMKEYMQKLIKSLVSKDTEKAMHEEKEIDKQVKKVKKIERAKENRLLKK